MWTFPHFTPNHDPDWHALTARFNWLADMSTVPQDPEWHGEGDVLTHTKMVAAELSGCPNIRNWTNRRSTSCLPPLCCTT